MIVVLMASFVMADVAEAQRGGGRSGGAVAVAAVVAAASPPFRAVSVPAGQRSRSTQNRSTAPSSNRSSGRTSSGGFSGGVKDGRANRPQSAGQRQGSRQGDAGSRQDNRGRTGSDRSATIAEIPRLTGRTDGPTGQENRGDTAGDRQDGRTDRSGRATDPHRLVRENEPTAAMTVRGNEPIARTSGPTQPGTSLMITMVITTVTGTVYHDNYWHNDDAAWAFFGGLVLGAYDCLAASSP